MFILEALQAKHGDALLLRWGDGAARHLAVIDGGPSGVFRATLRPRLDELRTERGGEDALPIRLVMVSHLDADHIVGVLDLTRHLLDLRAEHKPLPWQLLGLWHNSFDDVIGDAPPLTASLAPVIGPASTGGALPAGLTLGRESALMIASAGQGRDLRKDAAALNLEVNRPFGKLVWAPAEGRRTAELEGGLSLTVVGPREAQVRALQREWDQTLEEMRRRGGAEAQAMAAAFADRSVFNLASIVVLAARGTRRMLLTGDARGDFVLAGLEAAGLLTNGAVHVDLLKVPHHGSSRNVTTDFFRRVTADHYVISADGRDGNPDPEMLEMLTEARGAAEYRISLTNQEPRAAAFLAADRVRGRRYEVVFRDDPALGVSVALER